jgi:hypothetical protein
MEETDGRTDLFTSVFLQKKLTFRHSAASVNKSSDLPFGSDLTLKAG